MLSTIILVEVNLILLNARKIGKKCQSRGLQAQGARESVHSMTVGSAVGKPWLCVIFSRVGQFVTVDEQEKEHKT